LEVLGPKGPQKHVGHDLLPWARNQLTIADQIMDNPGGGLLFATTAVGQVKAALSEADRDRWQPVVGLLDRVEDGIVRRRYDAAREGLAEALEALAKGEARQPA
jgi:hypothetical protein